MSYFLKLYPARSTASVGSNRPSQPRASDPAADEDAQPSLTVVVLGDEAQMESVASYALRFEVLRPIGAPTIDGHPDPLGGFCA